MHSRFDNLAGPRNVNFIYIGHCGQVIRVSPSKWGGHKRRSNFTKTTTDSDRSRDAEIEFDTHAQRQALTFAIVGAGPTGVEMAAMVSSFCIGYCTVFGQ